jgi:hypothetical protein
MKLSKSILIFLFVSSTLSAFYYALKRTDGNVWQSIMFAMYFLAIKIGLIAPNFTSKLDDHQPNPQLVSKVLAVYNPYVSVLDDYHHSGLYMDKIEQPVPQHYVSYHSQSVIKELRAGSRLTEAAWLLLTIWMLQHQSVGFQPVRQAPPPPHIESAQNLLFGKPKSDQLFCQQASMFDPQEFEKSSLYSLEVLSRENALARITEEYGTLEYPKFDYIDGSLGLSATHQQLAAKTYHAPSYKLYPELYGISQAQMKAINDQGLVGYVQRGGELPSSDFIDAYHQHIKTFYARNKSTLNLNGSYRGERAIIVHNEINGEVLIFRADTKQLWTPSHLRPGQMKRYLETGAIGKQKSVCPTGTTPPPKTT